MNGMDDHKDSPMQNVENSRAGTAAKIKIVTDSTMDMTDKNLRELGVEMVPLSLFIDGQTFTDRVDISPVEFMEKMKRSAELPKSSQPPAGVFAELYDRLADAGYDVISIHMSGGLSGTVRSAEMGAQMSRANVTVVDSMFVSKALAFQVTEAAVMAREGYSMQEIVDRLETVRRMTRLYAVVDTLENLVKGGRIGKGRALIGSLLHIKPIAALSDGVYSPVTNVRSHAQVVKVLARQFVEDTQGKTIKGVGIAHAQGFELASRLRDAVEELTGFAGTEIVDTTPIISTHTGAGAIGFMYYFE